MPELAHAAQSMWEDHTVAVSIWKGFAVCSRGECEEAFPDAPAALGMLLPLREFFLL